MTVCDRTHPAIEGADDFILTREALQSQAAAFGRRLADGCRVVATLLDNGPAWILADRAAEWAGIVHVPLPAFFTPAQIQHALASAGADGLLVPAASAERWQPAPCEQVALAGQPLALLRLRTAPVRLPSGTAKVTFTSGTTGQPKGVCLSAAAMHAVAQGLVQALDPLGLRRHLSALPFAVLLENIAGVMAPQAAGGTCIALPLSQVGLAGSSSFDPARLHAAVERHRADSVILLPQMLAAWTHWLRATGCSAPANLRFVAVGGASVGERLLLASRACGIPAYEGYGLSEGASVQTLNLPGADRPGSAGRPLPHARVSIAADGEIEVAGSLFAGYVGDAEVSDGLARWPSGDLGHLDADGFLHVRGRKKNVLITGYGRNVSPEWVEGTLQDQGAIARAVVFGDAQPALSAVLWPLPGVSDAQVAASVEAANAQLPDYARVAHWVLARLPFTADSGLATPNGRPLRTAILATHPDALASAPPFQESP